MSRGWYAKAEVKAVEELFSKFMEFKTKLDNVGLSTPKYSHTPPSVTNNVSHKLERLALARLEVPEYVNIIEDEIDNLPYRQRQIFNLRYIETYQEKQIWEVLDINRNVYYKNRRALIKYFVKKLEHLNIFKGIYYHELQKKAENLLEEC